jgi:opacity protein-like surface antigen
MTAPTRVRRLAFAAVLAAAAVAGLAAPAAAQDAWVSAKERPAGINMGDRLLEPTGTLKLFDALKIHPSFRQSVLFDDNIFLNEDDTESDVISSTSVGLRLDLTPGDFDFTAGTRYAWQQYVDNDDESHGDWFNEFRAVYTGRTLRVSLSDTLSVEEDPLNFVRSERLGRVKNVATAKVEVALNTLAFALQVADEYWDFESLFTVLDHRSDTIDFGTSWQFSEERFLFLDYTYGLVDYEKKFRNDYTYHRVMLGAKGPITPRINGELAIGWTAQSISEGQGVTTTEPEYNGPTGRASLEWNPTPRLSGRISYINGLQFADTAAYAVVDRGELSVTWTPHVELNWRVYGWVENSDQPGLPPFLQIGGGTTFDWDWLTWLSTGLGLEYRSRTTDLDDASYTNFRVWWQVTLYL